MTSLTLSQAFAALQANPPGSFVTPIRMVAHGEDGVVLYAYGGLAYQPKPLRGLYTMTELTFTEVGEQPLIFDGETLATIPFSSATVWTVDNVGYNPGVSDGHTPATFQSFLVTAASGFGVRLGSAIRPDQDRETLLRISVGTTGYDVMVADIPMVQDGLFLRGFGPLVRRPSLTAIWTVSLLEPVPIELDPFGP